MRRPSASPARASVFISFRTVLLAAACAVASPAEAQSSHGRILFVSDRDERPGLYQMNADGTDASLLKADAGAAAFSPDGSKIAFLWRGPENGPRDLYLMNADGSGVTRLTDSGVNPEPHPDFPGQVIIGPESVTFHPTGDRVIFSDQGELFVVPIDGSTAPQQLTTPGMGDLTDKESPVFSGDGNRIIFAGLTETEEEPDSGIFALNWDIYAMNVNGTALTRLTTHQGWDRAPQVSPDGTKIVFVREDHAAPGIYTMAAAGGVATRITTDENLSYLTASFSPDGSKIVFDAIRSTSETGPDIFVINANGGAVSRLTETGYNANPVWGPGEVGPTMRISIANGSTVEGNTGSTDAVFAIRLSSSSEQPVSVRVKTANGTATAGEDFTAVDEIITFSAGEVERIVAVPVLGDAEWEVSETFFADLSEAQGATLSVTRAAAVIANDDLVPVAPGRLAFVSGGDIFVMNPDGSASYNLTDTPGITEAAPVWSPDGSKIAFVAAGGDAWNPFGMAGDIFVMNADGTDRTNLTQTPMLMEYSPSWSPDGSRLVFESNAMEEFDGGFIPDSNYQLYVMNADGSGRKKITAAFSTFPMPGKGPTWASTGKIFFADHRDDSAQILSINPDGTGETVLRSVPTNYSDTLSAPAVSPDGSKLAFVQAFRPDETSEQYDILLMNANGSGVVKLTDDAAPDHGPVFSPDGTQVVFSSYRDGSGDLFMVPVPGAEQASAVAGQRFATRAAIQAATAPPQRLTAGTGDESDADWDRSNATVVPPSEQVSLRRRLVGERGKSAAFTVRLSAPARQPVTLQFSTEDGTAVAGSDYFAQQGAVSFARGQRSKVIRIPIINDKFDEDHETFSVKLSSLEGVVMAITEGIILDDDSAPRVNIGSVSVAEPATGAAQATFVVRLSAPSTKAVTLDVATKDGTARAGADYTPATMSLSFAPGEVEKTVAVEILADASAERAESFSLQVVAVTNARGKGVKSRGLIISAE